MNFTGKSTYRTVTLNVFEFVLVIDPMLRTNILLIVGVSLILFGAINLTTNALAQKSEIVQKPQSENIVDIIIVNPVSQ